MHIRTQYHTCYRIFQSLQPLEIKIKLCKMASFCSMLLICLVLAVSPMAITAADPDPLQDFCVADTSSSAIFMNGLPCLDPTKVTAKHFTTSDLGVPGNTSANPIGFSVVSTDAQNMPGINTLGLSMLRADVAVGGLVAPHVHPRASEMVFIAQGEFNVGIVDTSNKLFSTNIKTGDVIVFPRGLVHYLHNIGSTPALLIVAFNSQNPGISFVHQATFASNPNIPTQVLSKAFNISPQEVEKIEKGLAGN